MCDVPVFYATTEGQIRRIADRIADQIRRLWKATGRLGFTVPRQ
jgi:menaquinone-dependent protoporphyrinogen IX oxidase